MSLTESILPRSVKPAQYQGPLDWRTLVQWLQEDGVITPQEAGRTVARCSAAESAQLPLVRLANVGVVGALTHQPLDLETLTQYLAQRSGLAYLRIDPLRVDVGRVGEIMSASYAERHKVLPVQVTAKEVVIATAEPFIKDWVSEVERQAHRSVRCVVANPQDIKRYTAEFFALAKSVRAAEKAGGATGGASFEQLVELGRTGDVNADDQHIVHIVDWLLQYAYEQRASDIHLEPRREMGRMRFRIDGVLHKVFEVPPAVMTAVVSRIKVLGRMDLAERRRPQDGRIKTRSPGGREVEMRLSTMPTAFGEKCVMRIFDPDAAFKSIDQLGFSPQEAAGWNALVERPHGIVLVTGPTGSGKTTTLYSTLKRLATPDVNVCTVEDPIEMIAPEFNQMQVQANIDLDFASGVRTLLRQDPDIIMIGEIRDLETAQMAVQASLTGHLVLSTLHTNDAPSAVTRLLDLGVPHYLLASTLNGILAQRLVRTLCPHCKQPDDGITREKLEAIFKPWQITGSVRAYKPVGCVDCRMTGYMGRMGLYELLSISETFRAEVTKEPNLAALRRQAVVDGMRPLRLAGALRVAEGLTTIEEVLSATPPLDA